MPTVGEEEQKRTFGNLVGQPGDRPSNTVTISEPGQTNANDAERHQGHRNSNTGNRTDSRSQYGEGPCIAAAMAIPKSTGWGKCAVISD